MSYSYDAAGRRTGRTLANSTFTIYDYDNANQLSAVSHQSSAGGATNTISQYQYGYDNAGNRTWVKRSHQSNKGDVYSYDAADQLTGVKYNASNPSGSPSGWDSEVLYGFDAAGNRTSMVERTSVTNTVAYSVNSLNQYTNVTVGAGGALAWWKLAGNGQRGQLCKL